VLTPKGVSFVGKRRRVKNGRVLASTDHWFRPRRPSHTGPDGALYVVDMYRQVIEHPQWIPPDWQKELDLRAGHDKGRIYRIAPAGSPRRSVPRLDKMTPGELGHPRSTARAGGERDTAHMLLVWKADPAAIGPLRRMADHHRAVTRMQALCVLDGLGALTAADVRNGLIDDHPGVQRQAMRLARGTGRQGFRPSLTPLQIATTTGACRNRTRRSVRRPPRPEGRTGDRTDGACAPETSTHRRRVQLTHADNVGHALTRVLADEYGRGACGTRPSGSSSGL